MGSLLHFAWEWSDRNPVVAVIAATNESTWEHLKMAFWPALLISPIQRWRYGALPGWLVGTAIRVLMPPVLIVALFYGYTSVLGTNHLVLDIGTKLLVQEHFFLYQQVDVIEIANRAMDAFADKGFHGTTIEAPPLDPSGLEPAAATRDRPRSSWANRPRPCSARSQRPCSASRRSVISTAMPPIERVPSMSTIGNL